MIEIPIDQLRKYARIYDAYVAEKDAERARTGKLQIIDCVELEELGLGQEIVDAIHHARSHAVRASENKVITDLMGKAADARRFAALHRTRIAELEKEIATTLAAAEKHKGKRGKVKTKEWDDEAERLGKEIDKAQRSLATAKRGAEKQDAEAERYTAEAAAAEANVSVRI